MTALKIFVEGGAKGELATECRRGFGKLLARAGFERRMPTFVACGGRKAAFDRFCHALRNGENALLIVDSEDAVVHPSPWHHTQHREGDRWEKPDSATDDHLHFMVRSMEAWLLADRAAVSHYFGNGFDENRLPAPTRPIESLDRHELVEKLNLAAKATKKERYGKGPHSFDILATIDPSKLVAASPWAKRFFAEVKKRLA